jgi:hypothetical protein
MKPRLWLAIRRAVVRQPLREVRHVLCPIVRPGCPCMQGFRP